MNFFKPQKSTQQPQVSTHPLQEAFTSLQTHFSHLLRNFNPPPIFARIAQENKPNYSTTVSVKKFPTPAETIEQRLAGVPVYALASGSQEYVLISGPNSSKNLGLFCFSEADADTLLKQMKSMDPSTGNDSQIVPVALSKVVQLKVDGVALRLIPEASQIRNALQERERAGVQGESFPGVPVFQSKSLILSSENKRYRPVFFRKEDLEKSLLRASGDQNQLNPAVRGDIQVSVLEDIIKGMKDSSTSSWDDVVFIPPGFDVSTDRPK